MKIIEVTFDPKTGDPKVETSGFQGGECLKATKGLEDALGKVTSDKKKAEFQSLGAGQVQGKKTQG